MGMSDVIRFNSSSLSLLKVWLWPLTISRLGGERVMGLIVCCLWREAFTKLLALVMVTLLKERSNGFLSIVSVREPLRELQNLSFELLRMDYLDLWKASIKSGRSLVVELVSDWTLVLLKFLPYLLEVREFASGRTCRGPSRKGTLFTLLLWTNPWDILEELPKLWRAALAAVNTLPCFLEASS